jgi:hypothetical protein
MPVQTVTWTHTVGTELHAKLDNNAIKHTGWRGAMSETDTQKCGQLPMTM